MTLRVRTAFFVLFVSACSSDPSTDAGSDAGAVDAALDAGVVEVACKDLTCNGADTYCKLTPTGPCTLDAGTCGAGQEECVSTGSGCTPERTPSCEPLGGCDNCQCLLLGEPCGPGLLSIQCRRAGGGIVLECPYP